MGSSAFDGRGRDVQLPKPRNDERLQGVETCLPEAHRSAALQSSRWSIRGLSRSRALRAAANSSRMTPKRAEEAAIGDGAIGRRRSARSTRSTDRGARQAAGRGRGRGERRETALAVLHSPDGSTTSRGVGGHGSASSLATLVSSSASARSISCTSCRPWCSASTWTRVRSLSGFRRAYQLVAGATLARSSFHSRFTAALVQLMRQLGRAPNRSTASAQRAAIRASTGRRQTRLFEPAATDVEQQRNDRESCNDAAACPAAQHSHGVRFGAQRIARGTVSRLPSTHSLAKCPTIAWVGPASCWGHLSRSAANTCVSNQAQRWRRVSAGLRRVGGRGGHDESAT